MKGDENEECGHASCIKKGATYFNHSTGLHYCKNCAYEINSHVGYPLCVKYEVVKDKLAIKKATGKG